MLEPLYWYVLTIIGMYESKIYKLNRKRITKGCLYVAFRTMPYALPRLLFCLHTVMYRMTSLQHTYCNPKQ